MLPKLLPLFPENITTFIDMFMGSGAVTFAMVDRAKYIIANDNDAEVFNLFMAVKEHKSELISAIKAMPAHEKLFQYWRSQEESDCVWKATRFLMLSNFGYLGKSETYAVTAKRTPKKVLLKNVSHIAFNASIQFLCCDYHEVLQKITFDKIDFGRPSDSKETAFVYADPPYIGRTENYQDSFTEDDTRDLFSILTSSGLRFAVSEFRHPLVMALAEEHGLYVTSLGERRNLKNRREEILITNYQPQRQQGSLFPSAGTAASSANNHFQRTANSRRR